MPTGGPRRCTAPALSARSRLPPGGRFEYTSGVPLTTATGIMPGRYDMLADNGETFSIEVPAFSLDVPDARRILN